MLPSLAGLKKPQCRTDAREVAPRPRDFDSYAIKNKFANVGVSPGNDSFFKAFAIGYGYTFGEVALRKELAMQLINNSELYKDKVIEALENKNKSLPGEQEKIYIDYNATSIKLAATYIKKYLVVGGWGDELEMALAADKFGVNVLMWLQSNGEEYSKSDVESNKYSIYKTYVPEKAVTRAAKDVNLLATRLESTPLLEWHFDAAIKIGTPQAPNETVTPQLDVREVANFIKSRKHRKTKPGLAQNNNVLAQSEQERRERKEENQRSAVAEVGLNDEEMLQVALAISEADYEEIKKREQEEQENKDFIMAHNIALQEELDREMAEKLQREENMR